MGSDHARLGIFEHKARGLTHPGVVNGPISEGSLYLSNCNRTIVKFHRAWAAQASSSKVSTGDPY
jgi:hypothetical protein